MIEVGGGTLGEADGHRLAVAFPAVATGCLARTRADPPENGGEDVIPEIDLVGVSKTPVVDRFEIAGDIGARRTRRLTRNASRSQ
jgi:hypothetical protein